MNTNIRWLAAYTADIFDDYLAEIKLPIVCSDASEEEDRHSNENSAMLYGMEYWNLVEDIEAYLRALPRSRSIRMKFCHVRHASHG